VSDLFTEQKFFSPGAGYQARQVSPPTSRTPSNENMPTTDVKQQSPIKFWRNYNYTATTGEKLQKGIGYYEKCGRAPRGEKLASWKHFDEQTGKLEKGLNGLSSTLFHAENLMWNNKIYIVEGEKDVFTMEKTLGLPAVCSQYGSKWNAEFAPLFSGKTVVVITDNDDPGKKYGREIAASLRGICKIGAIVPAVKLLHGLKEKGDISDVIELNGVDTTKTALISAEQKVFSKQVQPTKIDLNSIGYVDEKRDCDVKNYIEMEER
jgi:putative DNA primase/helicase